MLEHVEAKTLYKTAGIWTLPSKTKYELWLEHKQNIFVVTEKLIKLRQFASKQHTI
jgi:hypothetical protein